MEMARYLCECGTRTKSDSKTINKHLQSTSHKKWLAPTGADRIAIALEARQQRMKKAEYLCECGANIRNNSYTMNRGFQQRWIGIG
jgi:hypothetical protein